MELCQPQKQDSPKFAQNARCSTWKWELLGGNHQGQRTFAAVCTKVSYAQNAGFAKSRERPKNTARVGPARCDAASLKQTLIR
ncbi:hypothetical protein Z948_2645 [Sulfitobacter donghicola DSW-25 = KCTC 12864 = JCM 14565]|uniref:Uncharacterized protein n=1 Tax=Sulfitobacter donghicola DSW-25 = KCTC 12864 = JCM 14565 TaxID=1300350 RepID=A0A073ISE5_9RHOB|nr:hypothetical protein DSW25_16710 [Sulfitobacter donghicola DSW-25 = KCTC 12864 = JCM 14565]KIN68913.1 hypothetical protein Z948_2645 [Sulfitobacter donghicola DSW-25 = KCTC 12864 = JCM 14565]